MSTCTWNWSRIVTRGGIRATALRIGLVEDNGRLVCPACHMSPVHLTCRGRQWFCGACLEGGDARHLALVAANVIGTLLREAQP